MSLEFRQWQSDLTEVVSTALREFRGAADDEMEMFAVDCHPWNGVVVLAFLTRSESRDAPYLSEAAEMAAWKYYDFGANLACWQSALSLASKMRSAYEEARDNRSSVAEQFLQQCAAAVASKAVQDALSTYRLAKGFKITVPHPDKGEEYYRPR
jgi:hypothetical protein